MTNEIPVVVVAGTATVNTPVSITSTILIDVSALPILADPELRFSGQPFLFGYLNSVKWFVLRDYSYRTKAGETSTVQCSFVFNFADIPLSSVGNTRRVGMAGTTMASRPCGMTGCWKTARSMAGE
jgi:hypothetical protein